MIKRLYRRIFTSVIGYEAELKKAVGNCKTLLDVGCGSDSPIKYFSGGIYSVGVDAHKPAVEDSKVKGIHNKYYAMDAMKIGRFGKGSFDCVIASDLIEHLDKKDGLKLLEMMERVARKKVIIFTPNGFLPQPASGNKWQKHKSGWTIDEMKSMGYRVTGINGWKPLRKEYAAMRFWPKYFWLLVSHLTQIFTRNRPESAFQILCVKEL